MEFKAKQFAKDIKYKRIIERNLSFRDMATETGISAPTLCRLEKGSIPDIDALSSVCKWLGNKMEIYFKK